MKVSFGSSMPPDMKERTLEEIGLHAWRIDCPRITIKSRTKKCPPTYHGAGIIFYSSDGILTFKCYSHRERHTEEFDFGPKIKSGKLIPDDVYYDLTAQDVEGNDWSSSRIFPRIHRTADGRAILRGEIHEITNTGDFPHEVKLTGSSIHMWVFDEVKIPNNRSTRKRKTIPRAKVKSTSGSFNAWEFNSGGNNYLLINENNERLSIRIKSKESSFPEGYIRRVVEAFHLVLGKPMNWMAMKIQEGHKIRVTIRSKTQTKGRLSPPLPSQNIRRPGKDKATPEFHRRLFDRFMKHALDTDHFRHPIWGQLNAIAESTGASFIDAKALTLTVAIESLLGSEFPDIGKPNIKTKKSIQSIKDHVTAWKGNETIKSRTLGMIANLEKSRALDKMKALQKIGAITKSQYDSWSKLRNPTAHSYMTTGMPTPKMVMLLQECEVLFYHLIFHAIGYRGPYVDFSTPGWPLKKYPGNVEWM